MLQQRAELAEQIRALQVNNNSTAEKIRALGDDNSAITNDVDPEDSAEAMKAMFASEDEGAPEDAMKILNENLESVVAVVAEALGVDEENERLDDSDLDNHLEKPDREKVRAWIKANPGALFDLFTPHELFEFMPASWRNRLVGLACRGETELEIALTKALRRPLVQMRTKRKLGKDDALSALASISSKLKDARIGIDDFKIVIEN